MKLISTVVMALALLTGCSSILPKGPPAAQLYTLNPPQAVQNQTRLPVNLQILMPQAAPGLETERVALRQGGNQIDYYNGVRWAAPLNTMVQSLVVESFENTHALKAVGNDLVVMNSDYSLLLEIRDFQIDPDHTAHIRILSKLIKTGTQDIVMTHGYDEKSPIAANNMTDIMKAFDASYQTIAKKMIADTISELKTKKRK